MSASCVIHGASPQTVTHSDASLYLHTLVALALSSARRVLRIQDMWMSFTPFFHKLKELHKYWPSPMLSCQTKSVSRNTPVPCRPPKKHSNHENQANLRRKQCTVSGVRGVVLTDATVYRPVTLLVKHVLKRGVLLPVPWLHFRLQNPVTSPLLVFNSSLSSWTFQMKTLKIFSDCLTSFSWWASIYCDVFNTWTESIVEKIYDKAHYINYKSPASPWPM